MTLRFVTLIGILLLSACGKKEDPAPAELLTNANMEAGADRPNSWWQNSGGSFTTRWSSDQSSSTSHSLEVTCTKVDTAYFGFWAQTYEGVTPVGKDVTFTVHLKTKDLEGPGVALGIYGYDTVIPVGNGNVIQSIDSRGVQDITNTAEWKTYSVTLSVIDAKVRSLTVYAILLSGTTGTVWFDDASLHTN